MRFNIHLALYILLINACSPSPAGSAQEQNNTPADGKKNTTAISKGEVMKLVQREVVDKEGTGLVASTYLLPEGWTVQDRLYWEYNDATLPIRFKANLQSQDGTMGIQIFPDIRAVWSSGPSGVSGYPPPRDIISGLKDFIATERKGKNISYLSQKIILDQTQNTQQGRMTEQAAIIKISYSENNMTFEEEFYARLDIVYNMMPSMMGNMESVIWAASGMYACKATPAKLESCRKVAQTIASSARLTKPFYNRLAQVIQLLSDQVYARIYQAGQLSRIISQTNDQMLANIDASYRESQRAYDRTNQQFSDYMRGVDRYSDSGSEVQLPSGYSNAWVNDRGEYLLSTAPGYNPADDFYGNWRQLEKN